MGKFDDILKKCNAYYSAINNYKLISLGGPGAPTLAGPFKPSPNMPAGILLGPTGRPINTPSPGAAGIISDHTGKPISTQSPTPAAAKPATVEAPVEHAPAATPVSTSRTAPAPTSSAPVQLPPLTPKIIKNIDPRTRPKAPVSINPDGSYNVYLDSDGKPITELLPEALREASSIAGIKFNAVPKSTLLKINEAVHSSNLASAVSEWRSGNRVAGAMGIIGTVKEVHKGKIRGAILATSALAAVSQIFSGKEPQASTQIGEKIKESSKDLSDKLGKNIVSRDQLKSEIRSGIRILESYKSKTSNRKHQESCAAVIKSLNEIIDGLNSPAITVDDKSSLKNYSDNLLKLGTVIGKTSRNLSNFETLIQNDKQDAETIRNLANNLSMYKSVLTETSKISQ